MLVTPTLCDQNIVSHIGSMVRCKGRRHKCVYSESAVREEHEKQGQSLRGGQRRVQGLHISIVSMALLSGRTLKISGICKDQRVSFEFILCRLIVSLLLNVEL